MLADVPETRRVALMPTSRANVFAGRSIAAYMVYLRSWSRRPPFEVFLTEPGEYLFFAEVPVHEVISDHVEAKNTCGVQFQSVVEGIELEEMEEFNVSPRKPFVIEFKVTYPTNFSVAFSSSRLLFHVPVYAGVIKRPERRVTDIAADDVGNMSRLKMFLMAEGSPNHMPANFRLTDMSLFRLSTQELAERQHKLDTLREETMNNLGVTLLHCAAYLDHYHAIELLTSFGGADLQLETPVRRKRAVDLALEENCRTFKLLRCLLDNPSHPEMILAQRSYRTAYASGDQPNQPLRIPANTTVQTVSGGSIKDMVYVMYNGNLGMVDGACLLPVDGSWPPNNDTTATGYALSGKQLRVMETFTANGPGELTVRKGDIVIAYDNSPTGDGWIKVRVSRPSVTGNVQTFGYVPFSYLRDNAEMPSARAAAEVVAPPPLPSNAAAEAPGIRTLPPIERAECPICFDEMHSSPVAVFLSNATLRKRSCRHYIHYTCAEQLVAQQSSGARNYKTCPICRIAFRDIAAIPDFNLDPRGWFEMVDYEQNTVLSKAEVLDIFRALVPIDNAALEKDVDSLWVQWTGGLNAGITFGQLCASNGLLVYVRRRFAMYENPPQITPQNLTGTERLVWFFELWDEDYDGMLTKEEVLRGLVKTYQLGADLVKVETIRKTLEEIWDLFCFGPNCDTATFTEPDGLGETIFATFDSMSNPIVPSPRDQMARLGREVLMNHAL